MMAGMGSRVQDRWPLGLGVPRRRRLDGTMWNEMNEKKLPRAIQQHECVQPGTVIFIFDSVMRPVERQLCSSEP
jgi:hypothetical protein